MTSQEATQRAERLASLFVPNRDGFEFRFAVEAIANELKLVAMESDWQREKLKTVMAENQALQARLSQSS